jgi:hypothetical protein
MAPTVAGLMVGTQAALLSWTLVVVPVVAAFTATAAMSFNAGASWADAGKVGCQVWALGHFGWIHLGEGAGRALVSLSPLGIPLVSILACLVLSHLTSARGWPLIGGGLVGFLAVDAVIVYLLAGNPAGSGWMAMIGGGATALVGMMWANAGRGAELFGKTGERLAEYLRPVFPVLIRAAVLAAALVVAGGAAVTLVAAIGGGNRFRELFGALDSGPVGGSALILLCLALIPNLLAWSVAYVAGAGFAVGAGTRFSPLEVAGGTEPALPVFAFLPTTGPPAWLVVVLAVPVVAGAIAGWWLSSRMRLDWWQALLAALGSALLAGAALAGLTALAGGSIGPGRMEQVGAAFWPLAGWLWLELLPGAAVGSVVATWFFGPTDWRAWTKDKLRQTPQAAANGDDLAGEGLKKGAAIRSAAVSPSADPPQKETD